MELPLSATGEDLAEVHICRALSIGSSRCLVLSKCQCQVSSWISGSGKAVWAADTHLTVIGIYRIPRALGPGDVSKAGSGARSRKRWEDRDPERSSAERLERLQKED